MKEHTGIKMCPSQISPITYDTTNCCFLTYILNGIQKFHRSSARKLRKITLAADRFFSYGTSEIKLDTRNIAVQSSHRYQMWGAQRQSIPSTILIDNFHSIIHRTYMTFKNLREPVRSTEKESCLTFFSYRPTNEPDKPLANSSNQRKKKSSKPREIYTRTFPGPASATAPSSHRITYARARIVRGGRSIFGAPAHQRHWPLVDSLYLELAWTEARASCCGLWK